jgi:hypothetical protein
VADRSLRGVRKHVAAGADREAASMLSITTVPPLH